MFGSAAVDVRSAVAGPDGDLGSQAVFGQLESGVFFVNRAPIAGGTLKRIATVTQGDLDALNQQARADLISQAPSALEGHVPTGRQIVNGSEQQGTVVVTFDQTAGADAENVKVDARLTVSAHTFDPDAALQQARAEAEQRIAAAAGANARVLPDSMVLTDPQPIDGANNNAFMLRASGSAEAIVDVESLDALRSELTGVNEADALARIQQIAGIEAIAIDREHSWFGNGLPRTDSRISFVITSRATSTGEALPNNAEGVSAEAATPWAASTRP
jgi:hypothetical protein